jgi:hypothetical protein
MSNRIYTIVLSIAVAALIGVLAASYFQHRLTLSPISLYLLMLLLVVPVVSAVPLLPWYFIARTMPPALRERMRDRRARDPLPAYAVWTCVASLAVSLAIMISGVLLIRDTSSSSAAFALFLLWGGFFLYGWMGLIYTSPWIQTHGFAVALAALPTLGLSAAVLLGLAHHLASLPQLILVPLGLVTYGVAMVATPMLVRFFRVSGLID